MSVAQKAVDHF
jgi:hypothetical protein